MKKKIVAGVVAVMMAVAFGALNRAGKATAQSNQEPNSGPGAIAGQGQGAPLFTFASGCVNANGTLDRGTADVVGASRVPGFSGAYIFTLDSNVRSCVYTVSVGLCSSLGNADPAIIDVAGRFDDVNAVFVETKTLGGVLSDRPFHIAVTCGGF